MNSNADMTVDRLIHQFVDLGTLRVWSVIISVFGDLATQPGLHVTAADLVSLAGRMGIRSDAFRVAIHRLKNDGWLTTRRIGRNSLYCLTDYGYLQCADARPRVYARHAPKAANSRILLAPPAELANQPPPAHFQGGMGFVQIAPRVFAGNADAQPLPDGYLELAHSGQTVPNWLRQILGPDDLLHAYIRLETALKSVRVALSGGATLPPQDAMVLRVLIIHRWRQLLLRHADLPELYFPAGWRGEACRGLVMDLLESLPPLQPAAAK